MTYDRKFGGGGDKTDPKDSSGGGFRKRRGLSNS